MEKRKINKLKVGIVIILILIIIFLDAKFIMQNKKIAEDEENKETSSNLKIE